MPVLDYEVYMKNKEEGNGLSFQDSLLIDSTMYKAVSMPLTEEDDEKNRKLSSQFSGFIDAIKRIGSFNASDEEIKEGLRKLDGFRDFLEAKEEGFEESNIQRIRNAASNELYAQFIRQLEVIENTFSTGIDIEKAKSLVPKGKENVIQNEEPKPAQPVVNEEKAPEMSASAYIKSIKNMNFKAGLKIVDTDDLDDDDPQREAVEQRNEAAREAREEYIDRFVKIMAARNLADSVRGSKDRLVSKMITEEEVNKKAKQMKEHLTFGRFLDELRDDDEMMKKAIKAVTSRGHGGGLDDLYKDYLNRLPAGDLDNSEFNRRYMPTVKERITILKDNQAKECAQSIKTCKKELAAADKQINEIKQEIAKLMPKENAAEKGKEADSKQKTDPEAQKKKQDLERMLKNQEKRKETIEKNLSNANHEKKKIMLEIMHARNLIKAVRNNKSGLDIRIPVQGDEEKIGIENADFGFDVRKNKNDNKVFTDEAFDLLQKGHGGLMAEKIRENYYEVNEVIPDDTDMIICENMVANRMDQLRQKASEIRVEMAEAKDEAIDENEFNEIMNRCTKEGKKVMAEYLLLDNFTRDSKTKQVDQKKLIKDAPRDKVKEMMDKGLEKDKNYKAYISNMNEKETFSALGIMAGKDTDVFVNALVKRKKKLDTQKENTKKTTKDTTKKTDDPSKNKNVNKGMKKA